MVVSIGEILVDMIGKSDNGVFAYERYAGGAPFNVACAINKVGGKSGFVGCVGNDLIGRYLEGFASSMKLDIIDLNVVQSANTTLAFVELDEVGERSFCFYRKETADYKFADNQLNSLKDADIVHLGSLMLSEQSGRAFADKVVDYVFSNNKKLSFDINYREDIFPNVHEAEKIYRKYAELAHIVKYSEDELHLFTNKSGLSGLDVLAKEGKLICVTCGGKGSVYRLGNLTGHVDSINVKVTDTTGAGDAFYGALLSRLDGCNLNEMNCEQLNHAFRFANIAGALATTAKGAISALPTLSQIKTYLK